MPLTVPDNPFDFFATTVLPGGPERHFIDNTRHKRTSFRIEPELGVGGNAPASPLVRVAVRLLDECKILMKNEVPAVVEHPPRIGDHVCLFAGKAGRECILGCRHATRHRQDLVCDPDAMDIEPIDVQAFGPERRYAIVRDINLIPNRVTGEIEIIVGLEIDLFVRI